MKPKTKGSQLIKNPKIRVALEAELDKMKKEEFEGWVEEKAKKLQELELHGIGWHGAKNFIRFLIEEILAE